MSNNTLGPTCRVVLMSNNFLSSIENSLLPVSVWPGKLNYPCVRSHAVRACQSNCVPRGSNYTCAVRQWPLRLQTDSYGSGASLRLTSAILKNNSLVRRLASPDEGSSSRRKLRQGLRPDESYARPLQAHPEMDCSLPGGTSTTSHRKWQQIIMDPSHEQYTQGQGSVLGPLLFVCYVNDMPENITSTAYMFADDTKVYRNIKTHIDREVLQSDLSHLEEWSRKWQLRFNADKCKGLIALDETTNTMSTTWTETLR